MNCRIKRIDPFWRATPLVLTLAAAAAAAAALAARSGLGAVAVAAAAVSGIMIFLATKPALSGVFAVFGILGGGVTFIAGPGAGLSPLMRALATGGFSLFYMVLMDAVVIVVAVIYNLFTRAGFGGLSLGLEN